MKNASKFRATAPEVEKFQALLVELFAVEKQTLKRGCTQIIEENYNEGAFLWQSLLHLHANPQLSEQMIVHPLSEPHILLAAFLSVLGKKISPDIPFLRNLVAIQNPDQILHFCISGEVSLDKLKKLIEHQKGYISFSHKK